MEKTSNPLNVFLLGKKSWSAKALTFLLERGHNVVAVVAKDPSEELDRCYGTLYNIAEENNIPVFSSQELNGKLISETLNNVDLVISYLYWRKVKAPLLSLGKIGAINFHPAPLPDYKGLGGYNAAILDNKQEYGVTAHYMDEKIDEGPIIKFKKFEIDQTNETAYSLERKSQIIMHELFKEVINDFEEGVASVQEMSTSQGKGLYINREKFEEMKIIKPDDSEEVIERKIRAFWFPPYEGAKLKIGDNYYTLVNNKVLKHLSEQDNKFIGGRDFVYK